MSEIDKLFYKLLDTKYDLEREDEGIEILKQEPKLALMKWTGPDDKGTPFCYGSTALHYAANDGKLKLMKAIIEAGADVNSDECTWYASPLSWAANNAHLDAIKLLIKHGAWIKSANAVHAAAFGGSSCGKNKTEAYVDCLKYLIEHGANKNDRRFRDSLTPLGLALESGNQAAVSYLESIDAEK